MATIGEATSQLDRRLFVGRAAELGRFREWLGSRPDPPEILNVTGYGGIGKTSLLGAFREIAVAEGREVVVADARNFAATPTAFAEQLGAASLREAADRISETAPVLFLDTFEALEEMAAILQDEFLARLDVEVRVIISGRHPLIGPEWTTWGSLIRPMPLEPLAADEAMEFLRRRGLKDDAVAKELVDATQGMPLALVLGADLVLQFDERHFEPTEWPLVVRRLVETLMRDIRDPDLRQVLEAASVLHQFDQESLRHVSGRDDIGVAFEKLCRLSVVRPAEHGLMLHDEVRRFLRQDLRWRDPERNEELRERAVEVLRRRMAETSERDRAWLVREWFALTFEAVGQPAEDYFSAGEEPGAMTIQRFRPSDPNVILEIFDAYQAQIPSPLGAPPPDEMSRAVMEKLVEYPDVDWKLARDRDGRWLAYGFLLPICGEALALLPEDGLIPQLVRAVLEPEEIPKTAADTSAVYLSTVATSGVGDPLGAVQELARDVMADLLRWEVLFALTAAPAYKGGLDATRFSRVPGARWDSGLDEPYEGFVLDRRGVPVHLWLEAMRTGAPMPKGTTPEEFRELVRTALVSWHDDQALTASGLAEALALSEQGPARAAALRQAVEKALGELPADGDRGLARRAIELGYLDADLTHERAAERLNVSRTTFFRLLKRGIADIAKRLG